jgi:hypothetical protein
MNDRRDEFLLEMYKELLGDINRHILVVWQSVGVLIGALALFSLVEKDVVPLDIAASVIVLLGGWLLGHLQDAAYWYNRNLVIIANIERQFLKQADLKNIHYYFGAHRPDNRPIAHLRIQQHLAMSLIGLVLIFHFIKRVLPGFHLPWSDFDPERALPYLLALGGIWYGHYWYMHGKKKYAEILKHSPGIHVDTTGVQYGAGHGFPHKQ